MTKEENKGITCFFYFSTGAALTKSGCKKVISCKALWVYSVRIKDLKTIHDIFYILTEVGDYKKD
jgi:hypothetical protein